MPGYSWIRRAAGSLSVVALVGACTPGPSSTRSAPSPIKGPSPRPLPDNARRWDGEHVVHLHRAGSGWNLRLMKGRRLVHGTHNAVLPATTKIVAFKRVQVGARHFVFVRGLERTRMTDLYWDPDANVLHRAWLPFTDRRVAETDLLDRSTTLCVGRHCRHRGLVLKLRRRVVPIDTLRLTPKRFAQLLVAMPDRGDSPIWQPPKRRAIDMRITQGAFTRRGAREALVGTYGGSWHHVQWQLWLLRRRGAEWKAVRHLDADCAGDYRTLDVDGDGRREILVETRCHHQGEGELGWKLWSLQPRGKRVLFEASGIDKTGAALGGLALRTHRLQFIDLDDDGRLELVDHRQEAWFSRTGRSRDSAHLRRVTLGAQDGYRLQGGKYRKMAPNDLRGLLQRAYPTP